MTIKWGIVATVAEPTPLVVRFVTHHLCLGADFVRIYIDDCDGFLYKALSSISKCDPINCDATYWETVNGGARPADHRVRQTINANNAASDIEYDWIIHLDADEFLICTGSIGKELAKANDGSDAIRIPNYERIFIRRKPTTTIFEGVYRRPLPKRLGFIENLYGSAKKYMLNGMIGHSSGKTFVRRDSGLELHIHTPRGKYLSEWSDSIIIIHFDGLTKLHWVEKIYSKSITSKDGNEHIRSTPRKNIIDFSKTNGLVLEKMFSMFHRTMEISTWKYFILRILNLSGPYKIHTEAYMHKEFDSSYTNISPEYLDTLVKERRYSVNYRSLALNICLVDNFSERLIALTGETREEKEIDWIIENIDLNNGTVVDIGANFGLYSLVLGMKYGAACEIISIECNPVMVRRLKENIENNKLQNIEIKKVAISDTTGVSRLYLPQEGNLGEATLENTEISDSVPFIDTETTTIIDLMNDHNIDHIDFLKMDIEGHELRAMSHFFNTAPQNRYPSFVLLEMKHNAEDVEILHKIMSNNGYHIAFQTSNNVIFNLSNSN